MNEFPPKGKPPKSKSPFHIVNTMTGRHIGPFTTCTDALLARSIGGFGWSTGVIMDRSEFDKYLDKRIMG